MNAATEIPPLEHLPCFVPRISDEVYHQDGTAVSSSTFKEQAKASPAHARAKRDEPHKDTPALTLGKAAHCRILEPERYQHEYAVAPSVDRRTKAGKAEHAAFLAANPGAAIISASDSENIEGMAAAVQAHALAPYTIQGGQAELSGFFVDPETGVRCKIRPDYLRQGDGIITDLKTTLDANPAAFKRSIHNLGYHLQAAMYAHGFEVITGEPLRDFLFLTVEKIPPYAVALYRLDDDALTVGQRLYRHAVKTWADCIERDQWPAYSERVESISLPAWVFNNFEELSDAHQ